MEKFILDALPSIKERISLQHLREPQNHIVDGTDSEDDDIQYDSADEGFSFGISVVDNRKNTPDVTADEIFSHGHILPYHSFPNHIPTISTDDADNDHASAMQPEATRETLDIPKTAPGSPIKSWSTGTSTDKRNTIREFLFGKRSHSDGREELGFFEKGSWSSKSKKKKKKDKGNGNSKEYKGLSETDHYTENSERGITVVKERRKSFLPYFGFFGAGAIHGFTNKLV